MIKHSEGIITVEPIDTTKTDELADRSLSYLNRAKGLTIKTDEDYQSAGLALKDVKRIGKDLEAARKNITIPLDKAKRAVMDLFRKPIEHVKEAEGIIKSGILEYDRKKEDERREAEKKAQEAARREEEKAKKKLEAKAEKAEAKGDEERAAELRQEAAAVHVPRPIVPTETPKIGGMNKRTVWKFRVTNADLIPRAYLIVDEKALRAQANATQGKVKIPGVEFYSEEILSSRSE